MVEIQRNAGCVGGCPLGSLASELADEDELTRQILVTSFERWERAFRVGDSSTNIITPLMLYFPLIVVYCQKHCKSAGIGTLISTMLPYSVCFLLTWMIFLMVWWALGLPLGLQSSYVP